MQTREGEGEAALKGFFLTHAEDERKKGNYFPVVPGYLRMRRRPRPPRLLTMLNLILVYLAVAFLVLDCYRSACLPFSPSSRPRDPRSLAEGPSELSDACSFDGEEESLDGLAFYSGAEESLSDPSSQGSLSSGSRSRVRYRASTRRAAFSLAARVSAHMRLRGYLVKDAPFTRQLRTLTLPFSLAAELTAEELKAINKAKKKLKKTLAERTRQARRLRIAVESFERTRRAGRGRAARFLYRVTSYFGRRLLRQEVIQRKAAAVRQAEKALDKVRAQLVKMQPDSMQRGRPLLLAARCRARGRIVSWKTLEACSAAERINTRRTRNFNIASKQDKVILWVMVKETLTAVVSACRLLKIRMRELEASRQPMEFVDFRALAERTEEAEGTCNATVKFSLSLRALNFAPAVRHWATRIEKANLELRKTIDRTRKTLKRFAEEEGNGEGRDDLAEPVATCLRLQATNSKFVVWRLPEWPLAGS
ncbi:hypothetical protein Efla_003924 [Eimeria flavescens]